MIWDMIEWVLIQSIWRWCALMESSWIPDNALRRAVILSPWAVVVGSGRQSKPLCPLLVRHDSWLAIHSWSAPWAGASGNQRKWVVILFVERLSILSIVDLVVWTSISTEHFYDLWSRGKIIFQNKNWFCLCKSFMKPTAIFGISSEAVLGSIYAQ
jgi:hypothetical protein